MRYLVEAIRVEDDGPADGTYQHVARGLTGRRAEIWWSDKVKGKIEVEPDRRGAFHIVALDWDGTIVQTEGENGFFAARRGQLLREAGSTSVKFLERVWRWDCNTQTSVAGMLQRIDDGTDIYGLSLSPGDRDEFKLVMRPDVVQDWAQKTGIPYQSGDRLSVARIIAERLELLGVDILEKNPTAVLQLAPFMPGAKNFLRLLPSGVLRGVITGSRVDTVVKPILQAHASLGSDIGVFDFIVGEEHVFGDVKPNRGFYLNAFAASAYQLHESGKIPRGGIDIEDMISIADKVGDGGLIDIAASRRHSVIILGVGDRPSQGPLSVVVPDFPTLLEDIGRPLCQINSPVISRLAHTVRI